jgi:hypothetical protein
MLSGHLKGVSASACGADDVGLHRQKPSQYPGAVSVILDHQYAQTLRWSYHFAPLSMADANTAKS